MFACATFLWKIILSDEKLELEIFVTKLAGRLIQISRVGIFDAFWAFKNYRFAASAFNFWQKTEMWSNLLIRFVIALPSEQWHCRNSSQRWRKQQKHKSRLWERIRVAALNPSQSFAKLCGLRIFSRPKTRYVTLPPTPEEPNKCRVLTPKHSSFIFYTKITRLFYMGLWSNRIHRKSSGSDVPHAHVLRRLLS